MALFDKVEKEVRTKKAKYDKELSNSKQQITNTEEEIEKLKAELIEAEEQLNIDQYNTIDDKIRKLENAKRIYELKHDKILDTPLIDEAEYKKIRKQLEDNAITKIEAINDKALPLITQIKELAEQTDIIFNETNELLDILFRDLYKSDGMINPSFSYYENARLLFNDIKSSHLAKRLGIKKEQSFLERMLIHQDKQQSKKYKMNNKK
ncbi:hypothetical protein BOVMAS33_14490 [Streptococcus uberis]